ncbi:MAG: hypothetical protein HYS06_12955 [Methylocystis sp.]|nr:hypothetical protein [Methylocystis sp.]
MAHSSRKNIAANPKMSTSQGDTDEMAKQQAGGDGAVLRVGEWLGWPHASMTGKSEPSAARRGSVNRKGERSTEIGDQIGKQLRDIYEDVLGQPVPDRFIELLNRLERDTISPVASVGAPGER